jgi:hypothetical protein
MSNVIPLSNVRNNHPGAQQYTRFRQGIANLLRSETPEDKEIVREMKEEAKAILRSVLSGQRTDVGPSTVHIPALLSNMSTEYANEAFIGRLLFPDVTVEKLEDKFPVFSKRDMLAYPDDTGGGEQDEGPEVSLTFSLDDYKCLPRLLSTKLEQKTIDNEDNAFDWMMAYAENLLNGREFNHEKRAMALAFSSGNYGGTSSLGAAARWNSGSGGTPIKDIQGARDSVWRGRQGNTKLFGVTTLEVYRVLANHPVLLDKLRMKDGNPSLTDLANFFELDGILVAKAWADAANSGQTASIGRMVTTKGFGVIGVAGSPGRNTASFGYNLLFKGERRMTQWFDDKRGTRGTWRMKAASDDVIKITARDAGFFLGTVID